MSDDESPKVSRYGTLPPFLPRRFVYGTRAVGLDNRVRCASCGAGGGTKHQNRESATAAAVRDRNKPCRVCGAH